MQIVTDDIEMTELDWWIVRMLCKEIIDPRHEVEKPVEIKMLLRKQKPNKNFKACPNYKNLSTSSTTSQKK
jgi:hypothetical protein